MPVDPPEGDGAAVEGEDFIFDLNFAEAGSLSDHLAAGVHDQSVEKGIFSTPEGGAVNGDGDTAAGIRGDSFLMDYLCTVRGSQCQLHRKRRACEGKPDPEVCAPEVVWEIGLDDITLDPVCGPV